MEIYIEKIILLNTLIHTLLVLAVIFITNNKIKKRNFIISTLIGILNMYFYFLFTLDYIHYIIFLFFTIALFRNIKSTLLYFILNFILGGVTGVVNLSISYYYEVILVCSIIIIFIIFLLKKENNNVEIIIKTDKEYKFNGFYDTGCLINIGLTPVIVLNEKYNINLEYFTNIKINTIAGETLHNVYKATNVYLFNNKKKVEKHCLIILSNIDYEVIVGKNFIGGI